MASSITLPPSVTTGIIESESSSEESYVFQEFIPSNNDIEQIHKIPRFGHIDNLVYATSTNSNDEINEYYYGVITMSLIIFLILFVWSILLIIFKCFGSNSGFGCASGTIYSHSNVKIEQDWNSARLKRIRVCFFICCLGLFGSGASLVLFGLTPLNDSYNQILDTTNSLESQISNTSEIVNSLYNAAIVTDVKVKETFKNMVSFGDSCPTLGDVIDDLDLAGDNPANVGIDDERRELQNLNETTQNETHLSTILPTLLETFPILDENVSTIATLAPTTTLDSIINSSTSDSPVNFSSFIPTKSFTPTSTLRPTSKDLIPSQPSVTDLNQSSVTLLPTNTSSFNLSLSPTLSLNLTLAPSRKGLNESTATTFSPTSNNEDSNSTLNSTIIPTNLATENLTMTTIPPTFNSTENTQTLSMTPTLSLNSSVVSLAPTLLYSNAPSLLSLQNFSLPPDFTIPPNFSLPPNMTLPPEIGLPPNSNNPIQEQIQLFVSYYTSALTSLSDYLKQSQEILDTFDTYQDALKNVLDTTKDLSNTMESASGWYISSIALVSVIGGITFLFLLRLVYVSCKKKSVITNPVSSEDTSSQKCYLFQCVYSSILLPNFQLSLFLLVLTTCSFAIVVVLNADVCFGNPENNVMALIDYYDLEENDLLTYQVVEYYIMACTRNITIDEYYLLKGESSPFAYVDTVSVLLDDANAAVEQFLTSFESQSESLDLLVQGICNNNALEQINSIQTDLQILGSTLDNVTVAFTALESSISCSVYTPYYVSFMHNSTCTDLIHDLSLCFYTLLPLIVCAMIIVSLRVSLQEEQVCEDNVTSTSNADHNNDEVISFIDDGHHRSSIPGEVGSMRHQELQVSQDLDNDPVDPSPLVPSVTGLYT